MAEEKEERRRIPRARDSSISAEALLIDTLRQQLLQVQQEQALIRTNLPVQLEAIRQTALAQGDQARIAAEALCNRLREEIERRLKEMDGEIEEIRKDLREIKNVDLKELKDAIVGNQNDNLKRIIGAQAAVLLIILSAVVGLFIQLIHH
jgi:hypothetical protein